MKHTGHVHEVLSQHLNTFSMEMQWMLLAVTILMKPWTLFPQGSCSLEKKEEEGGREEKWWMVFRIVGLQQKEQEGRGTIRSGFHFGCIHVYLHCISCKYQGQYHSAVVHTACWSGVKIESFKGKLRIWHICIYSFALMRVLCQMVLIEISTVMFL